MRGFTTLIAGALIVGAWLVWHTTDATPDSAVVPASARTDGRLDGAFESGQPIGRPPATPARTAAAGISCVVKHLPSGAPASGAVRIGTASFPLVDGRCSVPQGSLASLLQEPPSLIPDALPGPPGTAQRPLRLRVARETSTQVELSAPDGWYVTATLSGMDLPHARVWIGAGSHTRTTSQPPDHDHDHEAAEDLTVDPRSFQPAELIGDRLTPLWIDDADAFVLAVVGPGGVLQETIAPPSAPVGHLVDLGAIDVPAAPGLRITVRSATGSDPDIDRDMHRDDMHRDYDDASFALDYARIPDPATPSFDAALALRHADPDLADFVLHDARLEISTHRPLLLSPLPSDPHAQLSLIAPSGLRAHPVVIALQTGRVTDVILDVAELFPNGTKGVSLRGLVHWVHDGTSVRSGRVEMTRPPRSVHLDQEGRFSIGAVPEGTRASLRLVGFDPEAPDRIERLTVQALQMAGTPDMEIRWKIAPSSVIRARGLPSGAPPLAFALQRHTEDRGFISTNLSRRRRPRTAWTSARSLGTSIG